MAPNPSPENLPRHTDTREAEGANWGENFPVTPGGYVVLPAVSHLQPKGQTPVEVAWVAVLGVRVGGRPVSLARAALLRAADMVRHDYGAEIGVGILLYLAEIGFRPAGGGNHLKWPPIRDGTIDHNRSRWRRPYIFALTSDDLYHRIHPAAERALLWDKTAAGFVYKAQGDRHAAALKKIPPLPKLRADDEALADAVRWHTGAFAYLSAVDLPAMRQEIGDLVRRWVAVPTPRSHRLSETLADWIRQKVLDAHPEALGTLLRMVLEGHVLTHATIRHHQHRALEELHAHGGAQWERRLAEAAGLHNLLYAPTPLFAFESWQFAARPGGALHVWLPEIVNLGWQALGRWAWLDSLMAACGRQDDAAVGHHLDQLRQELALLGSSPEALMMAEETPPPEGHLVFDARSDEGWGPVDLDKVSDGRRADEDLEGSALVALIQEILTPLQWDAWYLYESKGHTEQEIAIKLNISKARVSQLVRAAKEALQQDPRLKDWPTE